MHVQSTNVAKPRTILWNGQEVNTGIYKVPTPKPIYLGRTSVREDYVADTKVHSGPYKACYLFSTDHYPYWKKLYPNLKWNWGMFGENLTINGMNETQIMVGDVYSIGEALVQVTLPREPCFKFGVKFGTQKALKQFITHGFPGTYVGVLQEGLVNNDDDIKLVDRPKKSVSISQLFSLIVSKEKNQKLLQIATECQVLPEQKRNKLKSFLI